MIKKIQKYRKGPRCIVRDLRKLPNVDFKTRLRQEKDTLRHIELLGAINAVDANLQVSVSGISQYFQGIAKYDEGIAEADILFIKGELDKYEAGLTTIETQIKDDIHVIMMKMIVMLAANLGEAIARLAVKIAENSNPLKLIFSGPDLRDVLELSGKVADATTDVVKGSALLLALDGLAQDSLKIAEAFQGNKGQIEGLKEVVDKIRKDQADDIGKDADTFIASYAAYTPQTDRSKLVKNNELWSAFKDATCDLLSGEVGIAGATAKGIVGGKLLCERLEGTLAQFFTLREDIFDFQFQLVDAVAQVVRGNIAKRFARNIKGKGDVMHASQLLIGSFKMHSKFQTTASVFCDILEYQQFGEVSSACATNDGLFNEQNLNDLIAHSFNAPTSVMHSNVYIPTQARFKGDTGYIDLAALARGETVVFKPPSDRNWLTENRWISSIHKKMPFISNFELYLPHKEYKTGAHRQLTTTTVTIISTASNHVSLEPDKKKLSYILPRGHSTFHAIYNEGYNTGGCSGDGAVEIENPYSLCGNLPKICDISTRHKGQSLLPTILSTWTLSSSTSHLGSTDNWDAPKPATSLLLQAKVTLHFPLLENRSFVRQLISRSEVVTSENGCCDGNMVRTSMFNNNCEPCPVNSTSHLRGYYCEINEEE
ncbi:hypothetical protein QZH41_004681 [Actinostola sp. cb2023]|nr:hypothetical protein QZH41_004681 [Actinostola sp. cb2023]